MITTNLSQAAADALVELLPTSVPARASLSTTRQMPSGLAASALSGSFVGATSADVALILADGSVPVEAAGTDSPLVSPSDILRPALEAATAVLGAGVLGATLTGDATALFADPEATIFELTGNGRAQGWFAIRIRSGATKSFGGPFASSSAAGKLGRINNVEMSMTVEIGRTRMSVRDVLDLEPGGVIELDRSAGAPADVLLNGRLIAHGEVVVVDQDYAVRITRILDVAEGSF
ncbi:flagellar motor switch protein FliN [Arthrobacter sp. CAN_A1]|uniref:flagellar motor switch protein FliN n=1 Tax=Arthrobacter sp. CAN_A1 TaxID=2787717 RepID=UPI0018C919E0